MAENPEDRTMNFLSPVRNWMYLVLLSFIYKVPSLMPPSTCQISRPPIEDIESKYLLSLLTSMLFIADLL